MIVLGLGSNIGDKLTNLRNAFEQLKQTPEIKIQKVSPIYISDALLPENADDSWDVPYLNFCISCTTDLKPLELLSKTKEIEKKLGRDKKLSWSPRIIDIDILAWDNLVKYDDNLHIPHEHLLDRPFALWPLRDVAPNWIFPIKGEFLGKQAIELAKKWAKTATPLNTRVIPHRIDIPRPMGILNVTKDSFSDGGKYFDKEDALNKAIKLANLGAEIIDIGAESTGPKAKEISVDVELQRLQPILELLEQNKDKFLIKPKISIDTRNYIVADKALDMGVDLINDVTGLDCKKMRDLLKNKTCDIVFMHNLGAPVSKSKLIPLDVDPVNYVYSWAKQKILGLDIDPSRLIFDIGVGFGKTAEQSLTLINNIDKFKELGIKLLVGHSRKSFLTPFTAKPFHERDIETIVISTKLLEKQIDYLRIHNVEDHLRAFKIHSALVTD